MRYYDTGAICSGLGRLRQRDQQRDCRAGGTAQRIASRGNNYVAFVF